MTSSIMLMAYRMAWGSKEEFHSVDDRFVLDAETHLDSVMLFPFGNSIPWQWRNGLLFGFDLVIQLNGVVLPFNLSSDQFSPKDWFDELRAFVNPEYPDGQWPSMAYGLTGFGKSNIKELLGHFEASMDAVSSKHRLTAVLGSDKVHLMADASSTASIELEVMLRGVVAVHGDSKVHVLLLTHSVASDDREWVSLALRLPIYGIFSNASKWFLFYKMYHTGYVFDTDVARTITAVERLLSRFEDNLKVEELSRLDSEDILTILRVAVLSRNARSESLEAVED